MQLNNFKSDHPFTTTADVFQGSNSMTCVFYLNAIISSLRITWNIVNHDVRISITYLNGTILVICSFKNVTSRLLKIESPFHFDYKINKRVLT